MKKKTGLVKAAAVLFTAVLLVCGSALLYRALHLPPAGKQAAPESSPSGSENTIDYNGQSIPVKENVTVNSYDNTLFTPDEAGFYHYDSDTLSSLTGIDVSSHQGEIDWQQVAEAGVEFAMIRVGFRGYGQAGSMNQDTAFETNIQGALDAGLQVGVYFFSQATNETEVLEEARFVLDAIAGYDITMPVAYDWEHISNDTARTDGLTPGTVTELARLFCSTVQNAGYRPMIYFYQNLAYMTYDLGEITDYWFWLSEYDPAPDFYYNFHMWQYSDTGCVPGIETNVDLNLLFIEK